MKPTIKINQIRARATAQSYQRGEEYYENGAIFDTFRRGNELEARCEGSSGEAYHVTATLDDKGIIQETSCTCDYGYEGDCKHIVALLLTYLRTPEVFAEAAPVQKTLAERSKEELITLIEEMADRYPDLKMLIDRPTPRTAAKGQPVDLVPFQRELRQALNSFNEWGDHSAEEAVNSVAEAARAFADAGQWHHASAIYRLILEEYTGLGEYPADDEGELLAALNEVVEALVECLDQKSINTDPHERKAIIERLADAYIGDNEMGSMGVGEDVLPDALLAHLKPEDVPAIRERVMAAQRRKQQSEFGQWAVERLEQFQMQLDEVDHTSPEEALKRLHSLGQHKLVFSKLMQLGRVDEAIQIVAKHLPKANDRLQVLPNLVRAERRDEALQLAEATLRAGFDGQLADWLAGQYHTIGNQAAVMKIRLQSMDKHPSVHNYAALQKAAEANGVWARLRPEVLHKLEKAKNLDVLTLIYLHDHEWDEAWRMVESAPKQMPNLFGYRIGSLGFALQVAEASKHARPRKAIPVFVQYARQLIEQRTRNSYAQAAQYLSTARTLYKEINAENEWAELIRGIREEFRRLPALQDELTKAKL